MNDINEYVPEFKIKNKHLLTLIDYSPAEIFEVLHTAKRLKAQLKMGESNTDLLNKNVALIFAKSSTRTRVSFEVGVKQMGGYPLFLSTDDIQLGRGEPISDTVQVLERFNIDAIMIRTFKQSDVEDLAKYGKIPIINGLTDDCHPCQVLADLLTIWEHKGHLKGLKLAYFGDGNNMANSLLVGCAKCGMDVTIACPENFKPNEKFIAEAKKFSSVTITSDPQAAIKDADAVYTDVFFSMGQKIEKAKFDEMMRFQVNDELFKNAKADALFLHCLPAHRGEEVTSDVIDGKNSVIFDEAENRLHAQKAVMSLLIK